MVVPKVKAKTAEEETSRSVSKAKSKCSTSVRRSKFKKPVNAYLHYYKDQCDALRKDGKARKIDQAAIGSQWKELSEDVKAVYLNMEKASCAKYAKNKPNPASKGSKVATRCTPRVLIKLVEQLDDYKKEAIKEIGFGWVMQLKCMTLRRNLCQFLVSKFNTTSSSLEIGGNSVRLSPSDVEWVLGLNSRGADVVVVANSSEIDALYIKYFGSKETLTLNQLEKELKEYKEVDDGFIVRFVLFVLGTLLCPITGIHPKREFIYCLRDVESVSSLNWAKFVLDFLVSSIKKHKVKREGGMRGCLLLLQIFYYERFCIGCDISPLCNRALPRICDWGEDEIKARHKILKEVGGFESTELVVVSHDEAKNDTDMSDQFALQVKALKDIEHKLSAIHSEVSRLSPIVLDIPRMMEAMANDIKEEVRRVITDMVMIGHVLPSHEGVGCSLPVKDIHVASEAKML